MINHDVVAIDPCRFQDLLGAPRYQRFERGLDRARTVLDGRTMWHVNSASQGGGVAEMLASLLAYFAGGGIATGWMVVEGDDGFFEVTKRIHNRLHGEAGDGGPLGGAERLVYEETLAKEADGLLSKVRPGDVAFLHDPQTAGLAGRLKDAGAVVVWRCHIGVDHAGDLARSGWDFLMDDVQRADAAVFSRGSYAWPGLTGPVVEIVQPSIDAFSPKNQPLGADTVVAILGVSGLVEDRAGAEAGFVRMDGTTGLIERRADMVPEEPIPAHAPLVVQVSRWDRLKDPVGVLRGFAGRAPDEAHLVLAGPRPGAVDDDPEAREVFSEVRETWERLPSSVRRRSHLACLPMEDVEENGAIVNALQRRATVVVQKSLAEGFGLTVAEAMWKERCVVASRVGGIQDQVVHGRSGLLVDDPTDLERFGDLVASALEDGEACRNMARRARERVLERFLAPRHLLQYASLVDRLVGTG